MTEITFTSHGVPCAAWHLPATTDTFSAQAGRPCVVMAHGFGGTRDTGLLAYAEAFAQVGLDAFVFDYRGFGASHGTPASWCPTGASARTTTRRSPPPGPCPASTPTGSCCGEPPTPAVTSSRSPPGTGASRR